MNTANDTYVLSFADYEKADCTLFREKLIETNKVRDYIQEQIFKAWKSGGNATNIVDSIMGDPKAVRDIESQIAEAMKFQKEYEGKGMLNYTQQQIAKHNQEYELHMEELEVKRQEILKQMEEQRQRALHDIESGTGDLNAIQQEFSALQQQIQRDIKELGGRKALERSNVIDALIYTSDETESLEATVETALQAPQSQNFLLRFGTGVSTVSRKVWDYIIFWK